jgi:hypothetical protein
VSECSPELEARIDALRDAGWTLIESRSSDEVHARSRLTTPFTFETYRGGRFYREYGETLEQCVEAAEWANRRLQDLKRQAVTIIEGLASPSDF